MRLCVSCLLLALIAALLSSGAPASATVLTFDLSSYSGCDADVDGIACNGSSLPQEYGDRVTSTSQNGLLYGYFGGYTPKVLVQYGPADGIFDTWVGNSTYPTRFGDLDWALDNNRDDTNHTLEITLTADAGYSVKLFSLDLAVMNSVFSETPNPIIDVFIEDQDGGVLYSETDLLVQGETTHTDIDFLVPLSAQALTIVLDMTSLGHLSDNIAIDNVAFGQEPGPAPSPSVWADKTNLLFVDHDGDGRADPGDVVKYTVAITNGGDANAEAIVFTDTPDPNSSLVVGSVETTQGAVQIGNSPSDSSVEVAIGTLGDSGGSAEVSFRVLVTDPFPLGILTIANQGDVSGTNFDPTLTNDPSTLAYLDPTIFEVANTALDVCERELASCLEDPTFEDEDADGEDDSTDFCPNTLVAVAVDGNGCSLEQFCRSIDTSTKVGARACKASDWGNDEPLTGPKDCAAQKQGRGEPPLCVPAP